MKCLFTGVDNIYLGIYVSNLLLRLQRFISKIRVIFIAALDITLKKYLIGARREVPTNLIDLHSTHSML